MRNDAPQGVARFPMIGLVIVTHGALAREFRSALEHVVGVQKNCEAICIAADDNMEDRREEVANAIKHVDKGDGVILLTDMFGGTPSNIAIHFLDAGKVEVIAGVNLPLLVKLAQIRGTKPMQQVLAEAQDVGRKYIRSASEVLSGK